MYHFAPQSPAPSLLAGPAALRNRFEKERIEIAYEAAIWLLGNSTNPAETISTTNATRAGTALAPNRLYVAELRVPTTPTGTSPTLDITVQDSATGSTQWSTLATFPQQTTSMTITNPENTTSATQATVVRRAFRVTEARPYIHAGITAGGTSPVFPGVSLLVVPAEAVAGI